MSLKIPLNLSVQKTSPAPSPRSGIRLNLPFLQLGKAAPAKQEQKEQVQKEQVLRAVAAAVSLKEPAQALELAEVAKEEPYKVVQPHLDEDKLKLLTKRVSDLLNNRSGAPGSNESHQAVARAVDADPILVSAAHEIAEDPDTCKAGLLWVAAINADLLDRAARAASIVTQYELIPDQSTELEQLVERVEQIGTDVEAIDKRVAKLEGSASAKKTGS